MKKILLTALIGMTFLGGPIAQVYAEDSANSNVTATINEGEKTDESQVDESTTQDTNKKPDQEKQKDDTGYITTGSTETYMYATIGGSILAAIIGFFLGRKTAKNN